MNRSSKLLLILVLLCAVWSLFRYDIHDGSVIQGDGYGYYSYLHAWFIEDDPTFNFYRDLSLKEKERLWLYEQPNGTALPKMTMALAIYWTPFFLLAHEVAVLFGTNDGWSNPYQWSIWISALIALAVGLLALYRVLARRFSDEINLITIVSIVLGTSLFHYAFNESSMSHVYSFSAIAIFIRLFDLWWDDGKFKWLIWMSLTLAFITLLRPTNAIVILYPLLTVIQDRERTKSMLNWRLLILVLVGLAFISPQLFFWHSTTGDWLYYSYPDENFFWSTPHILEGLFSYRNGWLIYSPIMVVALAGFFFLRRYDRKSLIPVLSVVLVHIYIVFSWWCWYYGDSLSIRPMIDIFALLAIPMGAAFAWITVRSEIIWMITGFLLAGLILNNQILHTQYASNQATGSTMTKAAFWELFFEPNYEGDLGMIGAYVDPDTRSLRRGEEERELSDTAIVDVLLDTTFGDDYYATAQDYYSKSVKLPYDQFETENEGEYILISLGIAGSESSMNDAYLVSIFDYNNEATKYTQARLGANQMGRFIIRKPRDLPIGGYLKLYLWQKGKGEIEWNSLRVEKIVVNYSS